jgi:hypothetical protein
MPHRPGIDLFDFAFERMEFHGQRMVFHGEFRPLCFPFPHLDFCSPVQALFHVAARGFVKREFGTVGFMERFIEFCFEPGTAGNEKLKAVLIDMLGGKGDKNRAKIIIIELMFFL